MTDAYVCNDKNESFYAVYNRMIESLKSSENPFQGIYSKIKRDSKKNGITNYKKEYDNNVCKINTDKYSEFYSDPDEQYT